ncbi:MAG: translation initiation factor IF-3 [Patescibacteria group bacterium]|nr:translation initiation factor IF-3 [Patescibacteria group bacterium]MCL5224071.1 translation initiation factor IF-3 [Patescibacteria group bacterium]
MIDESGNNLGVLERDEAIRIAKEKGLDLVLITAQATPPVARVVNFDKFRYEKSKELKKQKAATRTLEMKQVQVSVREAVNDMARKAKKIDEFLNEGHKIEIQLTMRGREKSMEGFAREKLDAFLKLISTPYKVTQSAQRGAHGLLIQLSK